ncbi:5-formyltetrahydrofolate cyclo-ligase [Nocardiopsis kunsanensis]|uniref:5-formyltetrahydrofolate cyclo-ligase n=1 Tax=Nocardiopsis kunsanensis TaxID=141693 RepID=A0A919CJN3_9ACTN|nr:5-formyltetrahydrofolate cyclo-ligase [Nocardiopsis kunsanensis]GHD30979.1 hypothetical protein GCM10007147_33350 [Nocardiopsis kunsanensis]
MSDLDRAGKRQLRRQFLEERRALEEAAHVRTGEVLRDTLRAQPWMPAAGTVACYWSIGEEPDTHRLVTALWEHGATVLLPVFLPGGELDWAAYEGPESLAEARYGLLEPTGRRYGVEAPARVDLVVCPALAVDRSGVRLGRGAGCYDRSLSHKGPHTPVVVPLHEGELVADLPAEEHDVPVDAVVTPAGLRVFDPGSPVWQAPPVPGAARS